jgi:hypothetical protein
MGNDSMLHDYINPKNRDLIIFDTANHERFITERVMKGQVMTTVDVLKGSPTEDENERPRDRIQKVPHKGMGKIRTSRSRWTPGEMNKVIDRKEAGEKPAEIAKDYGVSDAAIYLVLRKGRQPVDDSKDLIGTEVE